MGSLDNLSVVLHGKDDLRVENRPMPQPNDNEVLIRMAAVGICGTDVSMWSKGHVGDYIVTEPIVLGHESSGVVEQVGKNVTHLKKGDRVAIEPGVPCRYCEFCKIGRYNLCPDYAICSLPPTNGTLSRYATHPADFCFKLPDNLSLEEGALCEPLSVAVQSCRRAEVSLGDNVLVCGAGTIGLVNMMVARAMGASRIIITDITQSRLEIAKKLGADETLLVGDDINMRGKAKEVASKLGAAPDISIECSGAESAIKLAILATKSGGTVALVGLGKDEVTVPIVDAATREVDVRGVFTYVNCFPTAIDLVSSGRVDVKALVSHRYQLEDAVQAYKTAKTGAGGAIKVVIQC